MFQPASVAISGPAFSFLLYETCKTSVKQIGFLLGEIVHKEITSITDNDQKQVDISKIIKINSAIPCPKDYLLKGRVNKEKLHKFLGPNFSKVVAWYKFEPSSQIKFTLINQLLHKQFMQLFNVPQDLFSVCFLTMEYTENCASYNYQQNFTRYSSGTFDRLTMQIPNLSESNNTYKNSEPASETFNKILSTLTTDIDNSKGVVAVTEIENAVQNYIYQTASEVAKAEKLLFNLENQVKILRRQKAVQKKLVKKKKKVVEKREDLISFSDMEPPPQLLPEAVRKPQRAIRGKRSGTQPKLDSNKGEGDKQINVEDVKKPPVNTKSRGRGRGRKKPT